ncbi:preprotein translocase subunit YajC [Halomonas salipaludis]|uniref:Preprotein translocase subunit YajC n=1 Tax=Halomonas salipaludis TaxID=2032625 RepID=A0A2A2EN17_9GAMM|nr:preprotein translocase subunit YajC [Halomonas salipaludis]PAU74008.1 preprotein translocase subunit YajC [Halomonas salipaludis]
MNWLLIAFIVALIVSPVMWLKPSPKQKRVARLREHARKAGVRVKLAAPPLHAAGKQMPSYRWGYPGEQPGPRFVAVRESASSGVLKPVCHGWRWRIEPLRPLPDEVFQRLEALLTRLPQDALVLESEVHGLTLWWYESQGPERFDSYLGDMAALRDSLAGRPDRPSTLKPLVK